nr:MAG TPA: hypothetical protein [Caudoviricetes sp.]
MNFYHYLLQHNHTRCFYKQLVLALLLVKLV